jgi:hypothetical protein
MRALAITLFLAGTVVASCYASRAVEPKGTGPEGSITAGDRLSSWGSRAGLPFGFGLVMMITGGVLARRGRSGARGPTEEQAGQDPAAALRTIAEKLDGLEAPATKAEANRLHEVLDQVLEEDVPAFLDNRRTLIDQMGLGRFAELMSAFASMERNAARAWSAGVDEVYGEIGPCLVRARSGLAEARKALARTAT